MDKMSWSPILGMAMRVVALQNDGTPMTGPTAAFVSKCFVSVAVNITEGPRGEEWRQRKPTGLITPTQLDRPASRGDVELEIIGAHKTLLDIIAGMSPNGEGFDMLARPPSRSFSIEVWTKMWQEGQGVGGWGVTDNWGLLVIPWAMNATWDSVRVEMGRMRFNFRAFCQPNPNWLTGPFDSTPELVGATSLVSVQPVGGVLPMEGPIGVGDSSGWEPHDTIDGGTA